MVPVEGVEPREVAPSFDAPRDRGERVHRALDIMAPRGTPVLAAVDGRVHRVRGNPLGGLTVYMLDLSERYIYYYAHLDRYRVDLVEGMKLAQGDVIGYVGTTGNAPADAPHLHFQLIRFRRDRYWEGEPIDPKPYLIRLGQRR
jgi:murein DD-endopeptidase MepM/ murein hydrolase activator NlpD